jgi:membrane protein
VGSRLFIELQTALTAVWSITPPTRTRFGRMKAYVGDRLRAMATTLGFGILAFAFLLTDLFLGQLRQLLMDVVSEPMLFHVLPLASLFLSLFLFALAFAAIYRWLPASHPGWAGVWAGAAVASILFALGRIGLRVYFHDRDFMSLFGAMGSVAVILIWVYYSMQILLFGATFAFVVGERRRSRLSPSAAPPA